MKKQLCSLVILVTVLLSACNKKTSESLSTTPNTRYNLLYEDGYINNVVGDLSQSDLKAMHLLAAKTLETRTLWADDWNNNATYPLSEELFTTPFVHKQTKFILSEFAREAKPPRRGDNVSLEQVKIDFSEIIKLENFYFVPVSMKIPSPDQQSGLTVIKSSFVFKKVAKKFLIAKYDRGNLLEFDTWVNKNEVIKEFGSQDWNISIYNPEYVIKSTIPNKKFHLKRIEYLEGKIEQQEFNNYFPQSSTTPKSKTNKTTGYYNRNAAVNYALTHAYNYNSNYRSFAPTDCANFISQCIKAGGFVEKYRFGTEGSCEYWWYRGSRNSQTWTTANGLKRYLHHCGNVTDLIYPDQLWYSNNSFKTTL